MRLFLPAPACCTLVKAATRLCQVGARAGLLAGNGEGFTLGDLTLNLQGGYVLHDVHAHFGAQGALFLLAGDAYDDDQDYLCIEWRRPGAASRLVSFHLWDEDNLSTIRYAFSELHGDESEMSQTTCRRHALYEDCGAMLEGLVGDVQARRDAVLSGGTPHDAEKSELSCFTCAGYGRWAQWDPAEVDVGSFAS